MNIFIDLEIVFTADDVSVPTRENSWNVDSDLDGRRSVVWYNQASMFQTSKTGFPTLKEARANGFEGILDFGATVEEVFKKVAIVLAQMH